MPISHVKNVTIADWAGVVTIGNSTGGTTTNQGSNLARPTDWNSNHLVSISASEISSIFNFARGLSSSVAAGGISAGVASVGHFEPFIPANTNSTLSAPGVGTWYFQAVDLPFALGSGQLNALGADAAGFLNGAVYSLASTGSVTIYQTMENIMALYTLGAGASTTRLESVWSSNMQFMATWDRRVSTANTSSGTINNGLTLSFPAQFDASGGVTYSTTGITGNTVVGTSTVASTGANSLITAVVAYLSGSRMNIWGFATSLPPGQYWLANMMTSTSSSTGTSGGQPTAGTLFSTQSQMYMLEFVGQAYKRLGKSVSDSSSVFQMFHGSLATTTSRPTSIVGTADIRNLVTNHHMYFNYAQSTY